MAKKSEPLGFVDTVRKVYKSGLSKWPVIHRRGLPMDCPGSLEERVSKLMDISVKKERKQGNTLFFVMYDIESNKVRRQVAKYLLGKGCFRVQRSVYLADISNAEYQTIKTDLAEVQGCYENEDSILIVPVSTELISAMRVIGKSINVDIITQTKNTLFF